MYYDRQIKYFDYNKDGVRQKGAGFLKIEIRDNVCNLSLQISGLLPVENITAQVYGLWEKREELLGNILLQGGRGSKELGFVRENKQQNVGRPRGDAGSSVYEGLQAIRIPLTNGGELYCRVGKLEKEMLQEAKSAGSLGEAEDAPIEQKAPQGLKTTGRLDEAEEMPIKQNVPQRTQSIGRPVPVEEAPAEEKVSAEGKVPAEGGVLVEENVGDKSDDAGLSQEEKRMTTVSEPRELVETAREESERTPAAQRRPMMEEKWEQLWTVYPHLTPFEDEREYLQMGLGDFVILRERFYRLVHNSFLLHGFYNYQHLILTRLERRGENFYYIGVPGNFYDREKQVALMYGFESFECAKEPAGQGDFGYYMIRVEL